MDNDASLVSTLNPMERLEKAKEFLTNHPKESKTTAARIYNINVKTLTPSIRRPEGRKMEDKIRY